MVAKLKRTDNSHELRTMTTRPHSLGKSFQFTSPDFNFVVVIHYDVVGLQPTVVEILTEKVGMCWSVAALEEYNVGVPPLRKFQDNRTS